MTCVAGWARNGHVWIGADSAGVAGLSLVVRADTKVFRNGPMLFGFTSSFRMGDLLRYALTIPTHHHDVETPRYMATTFVDAVRGCLKAGGFARKDSESESGGCFLVGYQGQLYRIDHDYQVGQMADPFGAVGCGADAAHGAMFALQQDVSDGLKTPEVGVLTALHAAERFSAGVRAPFHIDVLWEGM